ncbi:MAG: hypothetical protein QOJ38_1038 [Solirubrobacterales bacterium]|jgi:uncharacterized protein YqhQ|nr:hypothetical protein [Solirubrobacterales bacterium]
MALKNGLLIHGPTGWAAAARDSDGEIQVAAGPKPTFAPGLRWPGVRGPLRLAEAMAVIPLVRRRLPAARLPFEDWRVVAAMATAMVAATFARRSRSSLAGEGVAAVLGLMPALVALRDRDLAAYHGAEHKTIAAYEQGAPDASELPKEHERCGSNLIAPMLVLSVAGQLLVEAALERPGRLARAAVGVGSASAAVEAFAWSERNADTDFARAFHRSGYEIQRLVATREPTPDQLEVAAAALEAILRHEGEAPGGEAAA